jgi:hypothetical protein
VMVARRCHAFELDVTSVVQQARTEQRSDTDFGGLAGLEWALPRLSDEQ